jgi:hypothetical protein
MHAKFAKQLKVREEREERTIQNKKEIRKNDCLQ